MSGSAAMAMTAAPAGLIDHAHLSRYTLGNRALELEVLQLFAGQAPETLASLSAAATAKDWHAAAHTLKGSARCVGAFAIAAAAEETERIGPDNARRGELLARLENLLTATVRYIEALPAAA